MNVLISRKDLANTLSGVPKKVLQEVAFFTGRGHSAHVIAETIDLNMVRQAGGMPVKTARWPFSGYYRRKFYQQRVQAWVRKHHPDLVFGHGDIIEQDVLFLHNCTHLAHERVEGRPLPKRHDVGRIHEEILRARRFRLLICNSELMRRDLTTRFGIDPAIAEVIHPEVSPDLLLTDNPAALRAEWRERFGFRPDDFVFGMITSGNFRKRNLGLLLEAFAELGLGRLFIAGKGSEQQVPSRFRDRVVCAPPITDVRGYYHLIDTFILPAHIEEFGRSVLEAMFCGLPVITTDTVGASELMQGLAREYIMPSGDKERLKTLMRRAMTDNAVGSLNRETARRYSATAQNDRLGQLLRARNIYSE